MKRVLTLLTLTALAAASADGAVAKTSWAAREAGEITASAAAGGAPRLSDAIQDIWVDGDDVWVATVNGLGRTNDYGGTWRNYFQDEMGTPTDDVVAVAAKDGDVWASCIEFVEQAGNVFLYGRGLAHYDAAAGKWFVYGRAPEKGGLPCDGPNELVWDILVDDGGVVWVALWDGGIGKSADNGKTWELIVPRAGPNEDGTHIYSLAKRGDLIWAAAELEASVLENILCGAFKSEDNGVTWSYYALQHGVKGLCAVVDVQDGAGGDVAWVGTAHAFGPAAGPGHGVFKTEDGGATWVNYSTSNGLSSPTVYGFDSAGTWAWAGTYDGVDRTNDYGATWRNAGTAEGLPWYQINVLTAASEAEVWAGTDLGLAYSSDGGATWRKVEVTAPAAPLDLVRAVAFPSPFAQRRDGRVTFRYGLAYGGTITLDVYDFAGRRVTRVVDAEYRGPGDRIDEHWNGLRDDGRDAANGVYFFIIELDGKAAARGKFVILN
jgi:hypothetical protein